MIEKVVFSGTEALEWLRERGFQRGKAQWFEDIRSGHIKHSRLGNRIYIPLDELQRLIQGEHSPTKEIG